MKKEKGKEKLENTWVNCGFMKDYKNCNSTLKFGLNKGWVKERGEAGGVGWGCEATRKERWIRERGKKVKHSGGGGGGE